MTKNSDIKASLSEIMEAKDKRSTINAIINAERKKLKALGMTPNVINEALRILDADGTQRGQEDYARALFRKAYGFPMEFERVLDVVQGAEAQLADKPGEGATAH